MWIVSTPINPFLPILADNSTLNTLTFLYKCWARLCFLLPPILFANKPANILPINSHLHISFFSEERSASVWPWGCCRDVAGGQQPSVVLLLPHLVFFFLPSQLPCDWVRLLYETISWPDKHSGEENAQTVVVLNSVVGCCIGENHLFSYLNLKVSGLG